METVHNIIVNPPSKSCAALDPLPTRILKACLDTVLSVITTIINSSLESGIFPQEFKEGRLSPAFKNTSLFQDDFYRPITNLAFISKVLEGLFVELFALVYDEKLRACSPLNTPKRPTISDDLFIHCFGG